MRALFFFVFLLVGMRGFAQTIEIDLSKVASQIPRNPVGLCLSYPTDDDRHYPARVQTHAQVIASVSAGTLRFPMGTLADNYLWTTPGTYSEAAKGLSPRVAVATANPALWPELVDAEGKLRPEVSLDFDEFMTLVKKTGARPVVMVNAFSHVLPGSTFTYEALKQNAVEWVRYANLTRNYGVKYWEIGNELSVEIRKEHITKAQYTRLFNDFAAAMKEVDPTIRIGVGAGFNYFDVIDSVRSLADFIVPHQYQNQVSDYESWKALAEEPATENIARADAAINRLPEPYRSRMEILVTEFGSTNPNGSWKLADGSKDLGNDLLKSLHTFELAASALKRYDRIGSMQYWVTHSPFNNRGMGAPNMNAFDDKLNLLPQAKALGLLNRYAGNVFLDIPAVSGDLRIYGSVAGKELRLFLVNKAKTSDTRSFQVNAPLGTKISAITYGSAVNNPNDLFPVIGKPKTTDTTGPRSFSIQLPPVSLTVVVVPLR